MARSKKNLIVVRAPLALDALAEIWQWSAERFGVEQADRYLKFLDRGLDSLASKYSSGTPISQRTALRWKLIQRRQFAHGHIVVYRILETVVQVLRIYHTSEDWQAKIAELE